MAVVALVLGCATNAGSVEKGSYVLANARERGVVRCGSIIRPGLAVPSRAGRWSGLAVDVCRAIAAAVLGSAERIDFHGYLGPEPFRPGGEYDDVAFITDREMLEYELWNVYVTGPVVFHDAFALLVPAHGAAHAAGLAKSSVCVEPGTAADRSLTAYSGAHRIALSEHPFQEPDEMRQAYLDGRCDALAGPETTLANVRADPVEGRPGDRILPEILGDEPIYAATVPNDGRWSALVRWTFGNLLRAEEDGITRATASEHRRLEGVPPAVGKQLDLVPDWSTRQLLAVGNYGEIFQRNFGRDSPLKLPRRRNALQRDGGPMFAPAAE